ncbi:hypothetical protein PG990_000888 [Apiospora arundinis]|uniref:Uncharacterized protein n=1 Tax=Apiospora arundinis TaxID=335852 RepID=A0ABR2I1N6_9PEZI
MAKMAMPISTSYETLLGMAKMDSIAHSVVSNVLRRYLPESGVTPCMQIAVSGIGMPTRLRLSTGTLSAKSVSARDSSERQEQVPALVAARVLVVGT